MANALLVFNRNPYARDITEQPEGYFDLGKMLIRLFHFRCCQ